MATKVGAVPFIQTGRAVPPEIYSLQHLDRISQLLFEAENRKKQQRPTTCGFFCMRKSLTTPWKQYLLKVKDLWFFLARWAPGKFRPN
jgi:hypothetical protein